MEAIFRCGKAFNDYSSYEQRGEATAKKYRAAQFKKLSGRAGEETAHTICNPAG